MHVSRHACIHILKINIICRYLERDRDRDRFH